MHYFNVSVIALGDRLAPVQEARLTEIATIPEELTPSDWTPPCACFKRMIAFGPPVREGIAQADRGEFIGEEEMDARLANAPLIDACLKDPLFAMSLAPRAAVYSCTVIRVAEGDCAPDTVATTG
jgi:hypothetical protein